MIFKQRVRSSNARKEPPPMTRQMALPAEPPPPVFPIPPMKIYLHEIKDTDKEIRATEADAWVKDALLAADEQSDDATLTPALRRAQAARQAQVRVNLRKVDDVVVASGDLRTQINLLCSRCANLFQLPVDEHFSALYCKDKEMAGIAYLDKNANPRGQNKGYARHAHDEGGADGNEAADDLEITYIAEEFLDLPVVLAEQIQLRIPFQPLCKEDCKGICANCGADLNVGRCACSKIVKESPFAALKGFKATAGKPTH